ncbi:MAG TPA: hypothetical protein VF074_11400 [Pyrinomonadaceae bacterium]
MNDTVSNKTCERGNELISVMYGEATEREAVDFQQHLQVCAGCQTEMAWFGQLRESIDAWRLEVLSGFTTPQVAMAQQFHRERSALAAIREFFDLSPLWLKGATALASLLFVLLAVLAFARFNTKELTITENKPGAIYTELEKNLLVQKALEEQRLSMLASTQPKSEEREQTPASVDRPRSRGSKSTPLAKGRRPLSRWEREQLAADLRLLQESGDDGLELLGDRINQPED